MSASDEVQLDGMNKEELAALQASVAKALRQKEKNDLKNLISEIRSLVEERGYKIEDVLPQLMSSKRSTLPAKYVNPENPEQRWSGRGRKPAWIVEGIKAGIPIEDFEVH